MCHTRATGVHELAINVHPQALVQPPRLAVDGRARTAVWQPQLLVVSSCMVRQPPSLGAPPVQS